MKSGDRHSACSVCRTSKLGDDPCVKAKYCKICEGLAKPTTVTREKEKKVDDSILDEEDPPVAQTHTTSVEESLKSIAAQLASLNSRVQTMESAKSCSVPSEKGGQSTSTHSMDTAVEATVHSEGEVSDTEETKETSADKEPDASYVELLQGIKTLLYIADPQL